MLGAIAAYGIIQNYGITPLLLMVAGVSVLLFIALYDRHQSTTKAGYNILLIWSTVPAWLLSKTASAIRFIGGVFPFNSVYERIFSFIVGQQAVLDRRERIIEIGIELIESGEVEVDQTREELEEAIRRTYDESGRKISNGEAAFGFALAGVGMFQIGSPILMTLLSISLALSVAIRVTALQRVMFRNPSLVDQKSELAVMLGWNKAMGDGAEILKFFTISKAMVAIDQDVYEVYSNHIARKSVKKGRANFSDLLDLYRPMMVLYRSKNRDEGPIATSFDLYGENVFDGIYYEPPKEEDSEFADGHQTLRPEIEGSNRES